MSWYQFKKKTLFEAFIHTSLFIINLLRNENTTKFGSMKLELVLEDVPYVHIKVDVRDQKLTPSFNVKGKFLFKSL